MPETTTSTAAEVQRPDTKNSDVSTTRRRSLRKLPNNGDKNSNINDNLIQLLDKKQKTSRLSTTNKRHNKKVDSEKDRVLIAVDVSESSSSIKTKRDEVTKRRRSLRSSLIATRTKSQNGEALIPVNISSSVLSKPLPISEHVQNKDEVQEQQEGVVINEKQVVKAKKVLFLCFKT